MLFSPFKTQASPTARITLHTATATRGHRGSQIPTEQAISSARHRALTVERGHGRHVTPGADGTPRPSVMPALTSR